MHHDDELNRTEIERQLQTDIDTLRIIAPGLEILEGKWNDARESSGAKARGYFTPAEDDRVRQLLLAYRNYRTELRNIIRRCWVYPRLPWADLQLKVFLAGFATGLTLYSKSLKLIQSYEHEPLFRDKINEPDAKFEMPEGFFEEVLYAYSSLAHYRGISAGTWFWLRHRRAVRDLLASGDADARWLVNVILRERAFVRRRLTHVLLARLRYDWRTFVSTVLRPLRKTKYNVQAVVGGAGARVRTTTHYRPCLKPSALAALQKTLMPGDVLLVRSEKKLTSAILPGFWAHAALYVGNGDDLDALGIARQPAVAKHLGVLAGRAKSASCVIEAISPAVQIVPLNRSLFVDHVLVLRPNLERQQVAAAICEAFGHVGKDYDFEFDFNVSTRIVCTELVYRCYHQRGAIEFPLTKRVGRFTLTGDDVANLAIEAIKNGRSPFRIAGLVLGTPDGHTRVVESAEALNALMKIHGGWRPCEEGEHGDRK